MPRTTFQPPAVATTEKDKLPQFTPDRAPHPSTKVRKRAMLKALVASFGVVKVAADAVGIDRTTHYTWMDKDPKYKQMVLDIEDTKKDFVENRLLRLIEKGDTAATIYAAKTLLKERGYQERTELTGKNGGPIETRGFITHNVNFKNSKAEALDSPKDEQASTDHQEDD